MIPDISFTRVWHDGNNNVLFVEKTVKTVLDAEDFIMLADISTEVDK